MGCQSGHLLHGYLWPTGSTSLSLRLLIIKGDSAAPCACDGETTRLRSLVPGRGAAHGSFPQLLSIIGRQGTGPTPLPLSLPLHPLQPSGLSGLRDYSLLHLWAFFLPFFPLNRNLTCLHLAGLLCPFKSLLFLFLHPALWPVSLQIQLTSAPASLPCSLGPVSVPCCCSGYTGHLHTI